MVDDASISQLIFYYNRRHHGRPIVNQKTGRRRQGMITDTVCLLEIKLPTTPDVSTDGYRTFYARGVAHCADIDTPDRAIGRRIAQQRAEMVLDWFKGAGYDYIVTLQQHAKPHGKDNGKIESMKMCLLLGSDLSDLEKRILSNWPAQHSPPLAKPPATQGPSYEDINRGLAP